jgi:hypothetical protein
MAGIVGIVAGASLVQKTSTTLNFVEVTGGGVVVGVAGYLLFESLGINAAATATSSFGGGMVVGGAGKAVVNALSS